MSVSKDEEVYLHAAHTETSILYNLKTDVPRKSGFDTGDPQLILSPERIAIYGDREWRQSMFQALRNAVISLSPTCMHTPVHTFTQTFSHPSSIFPHLLPFLNQSILYSCRKELIHYALLRMIVFS